MIADPGPVVELTTGPAVRRMKGTTMDYVVAKTSAVIRDGNTRRVIKRDKTVLRSDDPLVRGRENLFRPLEDARMAGTGVEQATAAPGERRNVRRPTKRAQPAVEPKE